MLAIHHILAIHHNQFIIEQINTLIKTMMLTTIFSGEIFECYSTKSAGETLIGAVLDSNLIVTSTVCSKTWLNNYIDSITMMIK